MLDTRLYHHLVTWLGQWPTRQALQVVGFEKRLRPAWDGGIRPAVGIGAPEGVLLSVPPARVETVRTLADLPMPDLLDKLPGAVGFDGWRGSGAVFRWSTAPVSWQDAGEWVPFDDPVVPPWLRPFGGEVLVARDDQGRYLAGVGLKRHDQYGHEIAVGTEPAARGQGLARRLVAQAARRVLDEGALPTYLHDPANLASSKVAAAAGFPDLGWVGYGVFGPEGP